jgi:predicted nucleic acid-binding protein
MLFDTDVIIWALRGNPRAGRAIDHADSLEISAVSSMELLKGARDKRDARLTKAFLADLGFRLLSLSEIIGHRAAIYIEEYGLKSNLGLADALIAATAVENELTLCTGNARDYRAISELHLKTFRS